MKWRNKFQWIANSSTTSHGLTVWPLVDGRKKRSRAGVKAVASEWNIIGCFLRREGLGLLCNRANAVLRNDEMYTVPLDIQNPQHTVCTCSTVILWSSFLNTSVCIGCIEWLHFWSINTIKDYSLKLLIVSNVCSKVSRRKPVLRSEQS